MITFNPTYYDVHWYGPYPIDEPELDSNLVLYMICATHAVYGSNSPLYIGMTEGGISQRMLNHKWLKDQIDEPTIYTAAISEMTN